MDASKKRKFVAGANCAQKRSSVLLNSVAYWAQSALPQLVSLLLLPFYTQVLTPTDYATIALVQVFTGLISSFGNLQLHAAIARLYFDKTATEFKSLFTTLALSSTFASVLIVTLISLFGDAIVERVFPSSEIEFYPLFAISLTGFVFSSLGNCCSSVLRSQQRATALLRISVFSSLSQIGTSILLVLWLKWGVMGIFLATLFSSIVSSGLLLFAVRSLLTYSPSFYVLPAAMAYSVPLIPHVIGAYLFTTSDRIVLERFVPMAMIGLYAIADRLTSPLRMVIEAFNNADSPNFMELSKKSKCETVSIYRSRITNWFAFMAIVWVVISVFAPELILIAMPPHFHVAAKFIPILAAAAIFRGLYCFAVNPLFYEKKTKWIPIITVISGTLNVGLNLLLIPRYGVIAAAYTTLVAYAVSFGIALTVSARFYPLSWDLRRIAAMGTFAVFIAYAATLSQELGVLSLMYKIFCVSCSCLLVFSITDYANDLRVRLNHK